jgi:hypothetical protein
MSRKRIDNHGTQFSDWIRTVEELHAKKGYTATDLDYVWRSYKTNQWMLIEEKRYGGQLRPFQTVTFDIIRKVAELDQKYCGFVLLQFQNTSPQDGATYWNGELITEKQLVERLASFTHGAFLAGKMN